MGEHECEAVEHELPRPVRAIDTRPEPPEVVHFLPGQVLPPQLRTGEGVDREPTTRRHGFSGESQHSDLGTSIYIQKRLLGNCSHNVVDGRSPFDLGSTSWGCWIRTRREDLSHCRLVSVREIDDSGVTIRLWQVVQPIGQRTTGHVPEQFGFVLGDLEFSLRPIRHDQVEMEY